MQDVAAAAGVTKITVSRFLREPGKVAPQTAERIRMALAEQAYVPHKPAGLLASGRSRIVAAIVPSLSNSVFPETVQGLADTLQAAGFELMLASSGYSMTREEEQIRAVLGWAPDALVVTGRHHSQGARTLLQQAVAGGTPIVEMWDHHPHGRLFAQVGFSHERVGEAMADHLLALGPRALFYVDTGVEADFRAHERGQGFVAACQRAGSAAQLLSAPPGEAFDAGRELLPRLLQRARGRPLAVAFANDRLACGAWLEAQALGVAVPQQVALMGFGDFPLSRQLGSGISSIAPPRYGIGEQTARWLLQQLEAGPGAAALRPPGPMPFALMARGSTQRLRGNPMHPRRGGQGP